jgi:HAD superfamily hydrolase (TIGR01490 family)
MRRAAFFDLDGTLLSVNSAALWVQRERSLGRLTRRQAARAALFFIGYRLSLVDIEAAMKVALGTIRGTEERLLREAVQEWYRRDVAPLAAPGAFPVIDAHRRRGDLLVLLTSSSLYASEEAQAQFGLDEVLCTRYEVREGLFTGEAVTPLCYGQGKVECARALALERDIDLSASAFYTDSMTDLPMLLSVGAPHAVNADPRLRWEARRRGWPHLDWHKSSPQAGHRDSERSRDSVL